MKRLRRLPVLIIYLGFTNFLVFILSIIILGGDGLNGKVEAGHYYLGNHGVYTQVIYPIYLLSRVWGILLFVSWPFVMIATLFSWAGNGSERDDNAMRVINLGRAFHIVEGFFSLLFDAWRRPDLEFFTRLTPAECVQELLTLPHWIARDSPHRKPLDLTWGGYHFELSRRDGDSVIGLHGRLYSTSHGTYIKAWYRLSTTTLLFFSIFVMFGMQLLMTGIAGLIAKVSGDSQFAVSEFSASIWPIWSRVSLVIGLLLLIALSRWWGRHRRRELARLVKEALTTSPGV